MDDLTYRMLALINNHGSNIPISLYHRDFVGAVSIDSTDFEIQDAIERLKHTKLIEQYFENVLY